MQTIHSLQQKYATDAECKSLNHKCFLQRKHFPVTYVTFLAPFFSLHFFYLFRVFIHQIDDVSLIKSNLEKLFRSWAPHKRPAFSLWSICADGWTWWELRESFVSAVSGPCRRWPRCSICAGSLSAHNMQVCSLDCFYTLSKFKISKEAKQLFWAQNSYKSNPNLAKTQ